MGETNTKTSGAPQQELTRVQLEVSRLGQAAEAKLSDSETVFDPRRGISPVSAGPAPNLLNEFTKEDNREMSDDFDDEPNAKQELALVALLECGGRVAVAAGKMKVNESTLWRWLQEPAFRTAYRLRRAQVVEGAIAQMQSNCAAAARVLGEVMLDQAAPASVRVGAAKAVLDLSIDAVVMYELVERVEELERIAQSNKSARVS